MTGVRIVLILPFSQRGAILDELEVWAKAWRGSPVSHDGDRYSFGDIWMEPQPARTGGPVLWFGGSSLHPRLIARLVRYGSGFNPLGPAGDLAALPDVIAQSGASRSARKETDRSRYQSPDGIFINLMRLPGAKAGIIAFPVLTSTLQGMIICSGG